MAIQPTTLTSGMRANLVALQKTDNALEVTQKRLSTGKKVNSALDDPVSYFTALAHEQRAGDLAARKDEMSEGIQTVKAADAGIESIRSLIAAAKSLATSALSGETTSDINTLMSQYHQVLAQIDTIADDSGYKGVNLLDSSNVTTQVKFDELGNSNLTMTGFDASSTGATLTLMSLTAGRLGQRRRDRRQAGHQLRHRPSGQRHPSAADRVEQAGQQPEHHHRPPGLHPEHDQRPEGRRGRADQRRHERGRRQHADAPDASVAGHHVAEPRLSVGPVGPETLLT